MPGTRAAPSRRQFFRSHPKKLGESVRFSRFDQRARNVVARKMALPTWQMVLRQPVAIALNKSCNLRIALTTPARNMLRPFQRMMLTAIVSVSISTVEASSPTIHTVNVGRGGFSKFTPDTTFASVGDVVQFAFFPTGHSVIQSVYVDSNACGDAGCNPCVPYELFYPDQRGFHSDNIDTQNVNGSVSCKSREGSKVNFRG